MSKQNRRTLALARRKKLLLDEIQQQRTQLAQEGQTWLEVTAPYDKAWNILTSLKPILLIGASVVSLYSIKHPKKLVRWGRRAIGAVGLIRTLQKSVKKPLTKHQFFV